MSLRDNHGLLLPFVGQSYIPSPSSKTVFYFKNDQRCYTVHEYPIQYLVQEWYRYLAGS